jgi:hypothetical protein
LQLTCNQDKTKTEMRVKLYSRLRKIEFLYSRWFLPAGDSVSNSCGDLRPGSVVFVSSVLSVSSEFSTPDVEFLARHEVIDVLDEEGMAGVGPLSFGIASLVNKLLK